LISDRLRIELFARQPPPAEPGQPTPAAVRVREVVASGHVDLIGAAGSRASAGEIGVVPGDGQTGIRLVGPTSFSHRGPLEAGGPEGYLAIRSGGDGSITIRDDGGVAAAFGGGVSARRLDVAKNPVLTLDADDLSFTSSGADGHAMEAVGGARFGTQGLTGRADRILWKQADEKNSEIHLLDDAEVTAEAGANLDPFASPTATKARTDEEPDTLVFLTAKESIVLIAKEDGNLFTMTGAARVRRISDGIEKTRVTADRIDVRTGAKPSESGGIEILTVRAEGDVVATGRPILTEDGEEGEDPKIRPMDTRAAGDRFLYDPAKGTATLTGKPAEVRIREEGESWNRIVGQQLVFFADVGKATLERVVIEKEVSATVYLAVKKGDPPRPFTLNADRVEIVPAPPPEAGEAAAPASPEAQIRSLVATGEVTLRAAAWNAPESVAPWVVIGDRLTFNGGEDRDIYLEGTPELRARLTRTQRIGDRDYEDRFEARSMKVRVRGQRLLRFESATGGDLLLHRIGGAEGAIGLPSGSGTGKKEEKASVERILAHGAGPILFDAEKKHLRIDEETRLEQFMDSPDGFRSVAKFRTKLLQAWLETDEDGVDVVRRVEGRGEVNGEGDGWTLSCDSFEVDLKHHRTTIVGSPATVIVSGAKNTVERAVYDYVNDEWEFARMTGGSGR
jgi:hypothetical protein